MQKFFSNRKLVITVVCLIIAGGLMAASLMIRQKESTPAPQKAGNDFFGVINRVIAYPIEGAKGVTHGVKDFMLTYEENQKLRKNIDDLDQTHAQNEALKDENKQLKSLVGLKNSMTDYRLTPAVVLTRTPSSWQDIITIGKGTLNGVKKNQSVLAGNGLVGRVIEANYTTSKVELISDNNDSANRFAIQVNSTDGENVNGIITGYNKEKNQIIMGQVTTKKKVAVGERVITSGLGGVTPKGLYVGKVAKVTKDDYGLASEIMIKPATDMNDINDVVVAQLK
ncbi:rod shape-determining protein MreC [Pediococcus claussenii]|uniref:Cell shape-determining protein MreC n=1 Tax=Pediococcus claussenii (strain ATCC BAA-344 / DSM 14800 / JCM 18046 / KCTC 3811 / LMG 21948 / P06) TaxID=701521 RepID=G8PCK4_PEDCP|nr:rod shape-determining protein MreC [Pediococcus claussenii]AEV94989.1 rod shape-determining protein MreC [Pediococcus claussenii ATCC BAA-344]ANZ70178.1 rod shape-determining protein MreC [Pediococcus claussenii]ANZ71994.1 rod shape-determining protein MreC [Pediococcus claussenii]KRN19209.1 mreC protein [Pediococcus claussenii]